jgi:hypothetical protein
MSWRRRSGRTAISRRRATRSVLGGEHVCLRRVALAGCAELGIVGELLAHVGLQQPYRLTSRRRHEPAGTAYASRRHPMVGGCRRRSARSCSRDARTGRRVASRRGCHLLVRPAQARRSRRWPDVVREPAYRYADLGRAREVLSPRRGDQARVRTRPGKTTMLRPQSRSCASAPPWHSVAVSCQVDGADRGRAALHASWAIGRHQRPVDHDQGGWRSRARRVGVPPGHACFCVRRAPGPRAWPRPSGSPSARCARCWRCRRCPS